jgi:hypothetical protein
MNLRKLVPTFLRPFLRLIYYSQERSKLWREPKIKKIQDEKIKHYDSSTSKLILFLIEGADYGTGIDKISGGIISIFSICEESIRLKSIHGSEVLLCTFPGQHLIAKHVQFKNEADVFRYEQLNSYFPNVDQVLIHLPEYLCNHFVDLSRQGQLTWLNDMNLVHINVLNQNIKLMPTVEEINALKRYASKVTATTAHQKYCSSQFRDLYQIPIHKFSVWISPEKYVFKSFAEKKNLIIISQDPHPMKDQILKSLSTIKWLDIQIIQNLTYEQYKETISNAKWTLTFGEGLDGYLIEPIFSGAIGFAVYNDDFFTSDFRELSTIYESMKALEENVIRDIERLNQTPQFQSYQRSQFDLCSKYYSKEQYLNNIEAFYREEYTYA